jgi:hypothetical protein
MAIFFISLRLFIPLKGVLNGVPFPKIGLAIVFSDNGLLDFDGFAEMLGVGGHSAAGIARVFHCLQFGFTDM